MGASPSESPAGTAADATADHDAQGTLRNAFAVAEMIFTNSSSYLAFDAQSAQMAWPATKWADDGAATDAAVIHIHVLSATDVILDLLSASGTVLCVENNTVTVGTTYGRIDAATAGTCSGDW